MQRKCQLFATTLENASTHQLNHYLRETIPLDNKDLEAGSQLLLSTGSKQYPVTVIKGKAEKKPPAKGTWSIK